VGAGDLGTHFPDKDPAYKNISSLILLQRIMQIVRDRGFAPVNVDATLVAQEPRLAPHIPLMQANLAPILGLTATDVNVKATTTELMGFTGRGEGIAAYAVVLVTKT
jgi:2-C-methyl-D-erythritol 2,4-cyclodiphosphate synthase